MSSPFETIDAANRQFEEFFNTGKIDELAGLYTTDGTFVSADQSKYEGREQIKKFWQGARDMGVDNIRLTTGIVLEVREDLLIETSSYQHTFGHGLYQIIWKRIAAGKNEWQLYIDICT